MDTISRRLQYLHKITGISEELIAKGINVSLSTYREFLQGRVPSIDKLAKIAAAFKVPLDFILRAGVYNHWEDALTIKDKLINEMSLSYRQRQVLSDFIEFDFIYFLFSEDGSSIDEDSSKQEIRDYIINMLKDKWL